MERIDMEDMHARIQEMKTLAEELKKRAEQFPAVYRNTIRILSSIRMLEINVSAVLDPGPEE
jgi:hypothetical protein